jgi:hypothetical protein
MKNECGVDALTVTSTDNLSYIQDADLIIVDELYHVLVNLRLEFDHQGNLAGLW